MTRGAVERELRTRLSENEYRLLQARLTGAVKAIATLRDRVPDLLPQMFGGIERARVLPPKTQGALAALIDSLISAVAARQNDVPLDRRELLRVVRRRSSDDASETSRQYMGAKR